MKNRIVSASGWESKLSRIPSPLLIVLGPILGLVYITFVPFFTIVTFVLTGGFYVLHRLEFKRSEPVKPAVPR